MMDRITCLIRQLASTSLNKVENYMKALGFFRSSIATCCIAMASFAHAQSISFEAFKISDLLMSATWENTAQNLLPALMQKLESDLKADSATEKAAKVLTEEVRRAFSKDNFSQAFAQMIAGKLSIDEQRQTLAFLQSRAGGKYMEIMGGQGKEIMQAILPLFKQACNAANSKLGIFERGSLNGACGKL